jgi:hypothetical protein
MALEDDGEIDGARVAAIAAEWTTSDLRLFADADTADDDCAADFNHLTGHLFGLVDAAFGD